jgi:hypothetical protein
MWSPGYSAAGTLLHCCEEYKLVQPIERQPPYDSKVHALRSKELFPFKDMHKNIHSSFIHNSKKRR